MLTLLLRLFNLDSVDFQSAEGWTLRTTSEWAPAIFVLGSVALVILVWQVYKREKGTASGRYKLVLALLRLLTLAALVFVLLAPVVVIARSELKEACVVILADKSDSMSLHDRYRDEKLLARLAYVTGLTDEENASKPLDPEVAAKVRAMSRAEIASRALANGKIDLAGRIALESKVRQFTFASTVEPAPTAPVETPAPAPAEWAAPPGQTVTPLVITPDGPVTQIGESIRDAVTELRGQRIAAMVIISDWCSNSGLPPAEATRYALDARSTFPIFTVGVGDPAEQRDIAVAGVSANTVAFLNDPLVFNVAIEQAGYDGQVVPLQLRIDDNIVATKDVTLAPGREYYTISHKPDKTGVFRYEITVPPREDELSGRNNAVEHSVTVKDDKVRILLVAAFPNWEWRYLKNALARDKSATVACWLQSADTDWVMAGGTQLNAMPLNEKELVDNYDVIILLGASPEALSNEQLGNIRSFVGDFGGGLIFCAGATTSSHGFTGTPLDKCLPVSLDPPTEFIGLGKARSFKLAVTPEGWVHPALKLAEDPHENREIWENLPEMFWLQPVAKLKPGASVLATHPEIRIDDGLAPIFVEQRYGAGKVFFSATDETWRWRFVLGDKYFYRFWRQTIGLMAANKLLGDSRRLTLSVARTTYTVGQKVQVEARLLDVMLRPAADKSLTATIDLPGGSTQELRLSPADPSQGLYRGSFIARKVGSYAVWIRRTPGDKPERVPFTVAMSTLESQSRRLDLETMKTVANKTRTSEEDVNWFMIYDIGGIPDKVKSQSMNITTEHPVEIWDSWGCLILFAVPVSIEWLLRKRRLLT